MMFATAGNSHQQWKDREAAQAAAGYYNDSSVDLTPRDSSVDLTLRDSLQACHICFGRGSHTCRACNGKGTVWVERIEVDAA